MVKYIVATIASALVFGVLAAFFPQAFIHGEFSILTALGWCIVIMAWYFIVTLFNRRNKNKDSLKLEKKKKIK